MRDGNKKDADDSKYNYHPKTRLNKLAFQKNNK
jgi:hypothetical protein